MESFLLYCDEFFRVFFFNKLVAQTVTLRLLKEAPRFEALNFLYKARIFFNRFTNL